MSRSRHPNIHAVKFTVAICERVFAQKELPTAAELYAYYMDSLRGKANVYTLDGDDLKRSFDEFILSGRAMLESGRLRQLNDLICGFVAGVSCRLDEAVSLAAFES